MQLKTKPGTWGESSVPTWLWTCGTIVKEAAWQPVSTRPVPGKPSRKIPEAHRYPALSKNKGESNKLTCSHTSTHAWTHSSHVNTYTPEDIHHTHVPHRNTHIHIGTYISYAESYTDTHSWTHTTQTKNKAFWLCIDCVRFCCISIYIWALAASFLGSAPHFILGSTFLFLS